MAEPKIRFTRDDGTRYPAWKEMPLSEVLSISSEKNGDRYGIENVLSVSDEYGVLNQIRFHGRSFAGEDISGYKVVHKGQIVYTRSPLALKPYGIIKIVGEEEGIVSPLYVVNDVKEANDPLFIYYMFDTPERTNNYLKPLVRIGAKHTMNISTDEWLSGVVCIPDYEEQRRIALFLSSIDEIISTSEKEIENLETQKKAVMKKIFSQEVRFKKANGTDYPEWQEGCFGDLIEIYDERVNSDCTLPVLTSSKQYGIQYQSDHFAKEQKHDITGYSVLPRGYCTYRNRSDGTDFTFNINNLCDKGIVSKFYPVFKATDKCVLYFLMTLLNNEPTTVKKITITAKGTGQKVLSFLDLQKIKILIPCLEEQRHIADFLSNFDEAILSAKKEQELWKELKKGLLQQMFV